jgi:SAM-dependent methyltransferase
MKLPRFIRQIGKRVVKTVPILRRHILASTDYRVLSDVEEARQMMASARGWLAARTVERQESAYRHLIAAMKRGEPRVDFTIAAEAIAATGIPNPRVLEVGCGSGYYSDVLATLVPGGVQYSGIDYSDAMIARARAYYPSTAFEVADATRLPYADGAFDIVFNGVSLMHIVDYQGAIREAARVAARYCIFHTVPVFGDYRTTFLTKYAYGAPVVEIIFGKQELLSLCNKSGLRLEREWACIPYDVSEVTGHHSTTETYLFSKSTKPCRRVQARDALATMATESS